MRSPVRESRRPGCERQVVDFYRQNPGAIRRLGRVAAICQSLRVVGTVGEDGHQLAPDRLWP